MSSTSLTNGKSELFFSMVNFEKNHLKPEEKNGEATRATGKPGDMLVTAGISSMEIPVNGNITIDRQGNRSDGSKRKDMEGYEGKVERMEKINAAKLAEKGQPKRTQKQSDNRVEDR